MRNRISEYEMEDDKTPFSEAEIRMLVYLAVLCMLALSD